jgi:DNA-binding transcriptional LysR family regulator
LPKILQDAQIEQTILQSVEANLGVALLPEQVKRLPLPPDVVFRPLMPKVLTESCIVWKPENSSPALKQYVQIVRNYCASKLARRLRPAVSNIKLDHDVKGRQRDFSTGRLKAGVR